MLQPIKREEITGAVFNSYVDYIDASKKTVQTYARALRQFYLWLEAKGISRPNRADILAYKEALSVDKKPTTVASYLTAIKQFFKWAELNGIYSNIAEGVKQPKQAQGHKKDYLTANQLKKILGDIDRADKVGKRDYMLILLGATLGLRTIEMVRANIGDLRANGSQTVLYVWGKGKEDKTDFISISPELERVIRNYIATLEINDPEAPLFQSYSNRNLFGRMTTKSVSRAIKDRFINIGFNSDKLTAHSLRHSAVTLALLEGLDLQEVQQFARHSNISTTQIYAHNLEKSGNKCSGAIASALL